MPLAESNPAATLTFDAAVHRALARRLSDVPYPHSGVDAREITDAAEPTGQDMASEIPR